MSQLKTFISDKYRPDVVGGKLNKQHESVFRLNHNMQSTPLITLNAICFGPKNDHVLINMEHVLKRADDIIVCYYEDIHRRWTYVSTAQESYFIYQKNAEETYRIKPAYLYIRGCYIDPHDEYWELIGDFFNFLEFQKISILCSPNNQLANESKLFQLANSLYHASQHTKSISIGESYVIKGAKYLELLDQKQSYIVKSLSGIRSIVVDEQDFSKWDVNNINNIPCLFQKKALGNDLRIHIINRKIFAKRSNFKLNIDYRYDKNFFNLIEVMNLPPEIVHFCQLVAIHENNLLLGIDFIQTETGYVVLEANPSPGWSAYHPYNGIDDEPFILELLRVLKGD